MAGRPIAHHRGVTGAHRPPNTKTWTAPMEDTSRETWLAKLAARLRLEFERAGVALPERLCVSCGLTTGGDGALGECWSTSPGRDGHTEIFISPQVKDSLAVAETLAHELVHAAVGLEAGHGTEFRIVATRIGLTGPMRSTRAGSELRARLSWIVAELGGYPNHCPGPLHTGKRKQTTRLRKVVCPKCGYTARVTAKWIAVGLPTCPCGAKMKEEKKNEV